MWLGFLKGDWLMTYLDILVHIIHIVLHPERKGVSINPRVNSLATYSMAEEAKVWM